jgi:hypothetical protein
VDEEDHPKEEAARKMYSFVKKNNKKKKRKIKIQEFLCPSINTIKNAKMCIPLLYTAYSLEHATIQKLVRSALKHYFPMCLNEYVVHLLIQQNGDVKEEVERLINFKNEKIEESLKKKKMTQVIKNLFRN